MFSNSATNLAAMSSCPRTFRCSSIRKNGSEEALKSSYISMSVNSSFCATSAHKRLAACRSTSLSFSLQILRVSLNIRGETCSLEGMSIKTSSAPFASTKCLNSDMHVAKLSLSLSFLFDVGL